MPRPRPTIKRAIKTCARALVTLSHRVPLIGLVIGAVIAWLAFWMRAHPVTAIDLLNRIIFWTLLVIAACFVVLGVAGFIETISARGRARRAATNKLP
jgi:hypothetical protein